MATNVVASFTTEFQFPTDGKAYPKRASNAGGNRHANKFQFPTNGKAYPKGLCSSSDYHIARVSIPYGRESLSKAHSFLCGAM